MTPQLLEETSRTILEAQMALDDRDPKAAADLLLKSWGLAMRLAYPPRKVSDVAELALRCVAGEGA